MPSTPPEHTAIQASLLLLGAEMGLDVWVARNDRGKRFDGVPHGDFEHMVDELPSQFSEATQETIELIDVLLWLRGNSIPQGGPHAWPPSAPHWAGTAPQ